MIVAKSQCMFFPRLQIKINRSLLMLEELPQRQAMVQLKGLFLGLQINASPNEAFSACVYSKNYGTTQCEQADRHHDGSSAIMWVQVPR